MQQPIFANAFASSVMNKRPFYLTCPICEHLRFVMLVSKTYPCAACGAQLRVRDKGSYLIESVVLAPITLLLYWMAASILQSHGFERELAQGAGILAAFVISLPWYAAIRPYLVGVECVESEKMDEQTPQNEHEVKE